MLRVLLSILSSLVEFIHLAMLIYGQRVHYVLCMMMTTTAAVAVLHPYSNKVHTFRWVIGVHGQRRFQTVLILKALHSSMDGFICLWLCVSVCVCLCASVCCGMVRKEELKSNRSSSGSKYTSDNIIRRMNIVVVQSMT